MESKCSYNKLFLHCLKKGTGIKYFSLTQPRHKWCSDRRVHPVSPSDCPFLKNVRHQRICYGKTSNAFLEFSGKQDPIPRIPKFILSFRNPRSVAATWLYLESEKRDCLVCSDGLVCLLNKSTKVKTNLSIQQKSKYLTANFKEENKVT